MPITNPQGSYDARHGEAYAGMIATQVPATKLTGITEDATVGFGLAVGQGTSDRQVKLGAGTYRGITIANKAAGFGTADTYAQGDALAYMTKGEIYVTAANAVAVSDPVTYDATGAIGKGYANTISNARFKTGAASGALVVVHLD